MITIGDTNGNVFHDKSTASNIILNSREKMVRSNSSKSAVVKVLQKVLEARDYRTEGHGRRMRNLLYSFVKIIGESPSAELDCELLAHFHDIGKIGIPDKILYKKSNLSEAEWVIMKRHCEIGFHIVKVVPELAIISEWILKHHERFDGKGYPLGLIGNDIPLECRMLSIVDAYDAMTNNRPYRKCMRHEEAIAELRKYAGTQFDPELVGIFVKGTENGWIDCFAYDNL